LNGGNVFTLVALDALDENLGGCELLGATGFGGGGFCSFLLGVLFGAFLSIDGEGGEVLFYGFCAQVSILLCECFYSRKSKGLAMVSLATHLSSTACCAYLGGSHRAILRTSSLCHRTRSTAAHSLAIWEVATRLGVVPTSGGRLHTTDY
jgi:hypothetical protein